MVNSLPAPLHIIQDSRYAKQDGWELDDISLCSSGNIAVSGHRGYPHYQSYVCIYGSTVDNSDSRDKPTLLYHRQFTDGLSWLSWLPRCISFIKPNSTEIVTCRYDEVQVIDYNRDVVLRSRKVNGVTRCLSVSESQIFIGLLGSDIVNIYDNDLNRIKSIRLKGIRYDWPWDIAAAADRLYVCTEVYGRAIVYSQDSGSILTEYSNVTGQHSIYIPSIEVNIQYQIVSVLWNLKQVALYSINNNKCLVVFDVESGVSRIRISDQGRIVTGNRSTGEVKVYNVAQFFTCDNLKVTLSSLLSESDQEELVKYFKISDDILKDDRDHSNDSDDSDDSGDSDDSDGMGDGKKKAARIFTVLEMKGFLQDRNFHDLKQAFSHVGSRNTSMVMSHIDFYQKHIEKNASSDQQTSEDNESGQKLQLDRFSADWLACDISMDTCLNMAVVAGYCRNPGKTSLDFVCKGNSDSWSPGVKTKEFEEVSNSERIVSFIYKQTVVTCCGNVIEIINCDTNETKIQRTFRSRDSIATCVTVRNEDVFIGFKKSTKILVLNRELQDKKTLTLNGMKSMWPMDLAAFSGKLLVCLKDNSSFQVILFNEENGRMLVEYRNVENEYTTPQSVSACEDTDLVGILWSTDAEDYDGEPYCHIALHSLTHGYCLFYSTVALTIHDFECDHYQGCPYGKRLRLTSERAVVMDNHGGIKFYSMDQIISFDTWKTGFAHSFSSYEYEMLIAFYHLSIDDIIDEIDEERLEDGKITFVDRMKSTMTILIRKGYISSTNVTTLKNAFAGLGKLYVDRLHQPLEAYIKYASESCITERTVEVPFGPSDNIAEWLLQLKYSVHSQNLNTCAITVYQQGNPSQSFPGQLSSQQPTISSLPGPSNRSSIAGKRVLNESQQLNRESNGGKRIRLSDSDSQAIPQTTSSMLHLLQGDVSFQPASVSTPSESFTPVPESSVLQTLVPIGTTPLLNGTEVPHNVDGGSTVMSVTPGNQREPQNMLVQSMQQLHETLPVSFGVHQPVESHRSDSFTELHPANQVRQNEHLPPAQQVIFSGGPTGAHQVIEAGLSQTFQNREHPVQPCTPRGLAMSRNHMPTQLRPSMPTQPQVVNIEQTSQRCESTIQLQNEQNIVGNIQQQLLIPQNEMNNTRRRERTESQVHIANESEPNTQHTALLSNVVQQDLPHGELQTGFGGTECESIEKKILLACKQMEASAESSFQKHQTIVLKGIFEKLGCMPSSSKSHQLQETPGTSLLSMSKESASRNVAEHEHQAITYLESLQEDDKNLFLAFKDMSDDREELVRRLVEKIFTGEERKNGNTSGTGNFQKLDENKLQKLRSVVFYLCPIRTRKQCTYKLQDKEWKQMCEVIDTANRHYRQELKRQAKRK